MHEKDEPLMQREQEQMQTEDMRSGEREAFDTVECQRLCGYCTWWNAKKGVGFLRAWDEIDSQAATIFVDKKGLRGSGLKTLEPNWPVRYRLAVIEGRSIATEITRFCPDCSYYCNHVPRNTFCGPRREEVPADSLQDNGADEHVDIIEKDPRGVLTGGSAIVPEVVGRCLNNDILWEGSNRPPAKWIKKILRATSEEVMSLLKQQVEELPRENFYDLLLRISPQLAAGNPQQKNITKEELFARVQQERIEEIYWEDFIFDMLGLGRGTWVYSWEKGGDWDPQQQTLVKRNQRESWSERLVGNITIGLAAGFDARGAATDEVAYRKGVHIKCDIPICQDCGEMPADFECKACDALFCGECNIQVHSVTAHDVTPLAKERLTHKIGESANHCQFLRALSIGDASAVLDCLETGRDAMDFAPESHEAFKAEDVTLIIQSIELKDSAVTQTSLLILRQMFEDLDSVLTIIDGFGVEVLCSLMNKTMEDYDSRTKRERQIIDIDYKFCNQLEMLCILLAEMSTVASHLKCLFQSFSQLNLTNRLIQHADRKLNEWMEYRYEQDLVRQVAKFELEACVDQSSAPKHVNRWDLQAGVCKLMSKMVSSETDLSKDNTRTFWDFLLSVLHSYDNDLRVLQFCLPLLGDMAVKIGLNHDQEDGDSLNKSLLPYKFEGFVQTIREHVKRNTELHEPQKGKLILQSHIEVQALLIEILAKIASIECVSRYMLTPNPNPKWMGYVDLVHLSILNFDKSADVQVQCIRTLVGLEISLDKATVVTEKILGSLVKCIYTFMHNTELQEAAYLLIYTHCARQYKQLSTIEVSCAKVDENINFIRICFSSLISQISSLSCAKLICRLLNYLFKDAAYNSVSASSQTRRANPTPDVRTDVHGLLADLDTVEIHPVDSRGMPRVDVTTSVSMAAKHIVDAMRMNDDSELDVEACSLLYKLVVGNDSFRKDASLSGAFFIVMDRMANRERNAHMIQESCWFLSSLVIDDDCMAALTHTEVRGLNVLRRIGRTFFHDDEVCLAWCTLVRVLPEYVLGHKWFMCIEDLRASLDKRMSLKYAAMGGVMMNSEDTYPNETAMNFINESEPSFVSRLEQIRALCDHILGRPNVQSIIDNEMLQDFRAMHHQRNKRTLLRTYCHFRERWWTTREIILKRDAKRRGLSLAKLSAEIREVLHERDCLLETEVVLAEIQKRTTETITDPTTATSSNSTGSSTTEGSHTNGGVIAEGDDDGDEDDDAYEDAYLRKYGNNESNELNACFDPVVNADVSQCPPWSSNWRHLKPPAHTEKRHQKMKPCFLSWRTWRKHHAYRKRAKCGRSFSSKKEAFLMLGN